MSDEHDEDVPHEEPCENPGPEITVDRGQPVIVTVTFGDGDPDEVYFSYIRPNDERPYTDDGYGQPKSRIERLDDGVYRATIDTTGFDPGEGTWHFSGQWFVPQGNGYNKASIFGAYFIRKNPMQLL